MHGRPRGRDPEWSHSREVLLHHLSRIVAGAIPHWLTTNAVGCLEWLATAPDTAVIAAASAGDVVHLELARKMGPRQLAALRKGDVTEGVGDAFADVLEANARAAIVNRQALLALCLEWWNRNAMELEDTDFEAEMVLLLDAKP